MSINSDSKLKKESRPVLVAASVILMSLFFGPILAAWQEPTVAPPNGNVAAPVNIGDTAQTKSGSLSVGGDFYAPMIYDSNDSNYYVDPSGQTILAGNVGIGAGLTSPNNTIQVKDLISFPNSVQGTFLGYQAGDVNTGTGYYNTFVGYQAGRVNTTGQANTAIGVSSLYSNVSGYENVANGYKSLEFNTGGYGNTAIGAHSLEFNTGGYGNTAGGKSSLQGNTTGNYNTAFGYLSLRYNTTGISNVAYGYQSLFSNMTGIANTAIGTNSLYNNTGSYNTVIGAGSLYQNISGTNNTAVGHSALQDNQTGSSNVALGDYAGRYETGSNAFYVDNQDRGSSAGGKTKALLYGTFDADPSNQQLTVNGALNVAGTLTVGGAAVGGGPWILSGSNIYASSTSWNLGVGTTDLSDFSNSKAVFTNSDTGASSSWLTGLVGEAASDGVTIAEGILGVGKANGTKAGIGVYGIGKVTNAADTSNAYGVYGVSNDVHTGAINFGVWGQADNSPYANYGVEGRTKPNAITSYASAGGFFEGWSYTSNSAYGVYANAWANLSTDTGNGYAARLVSNAARAGSNYGVSATASGATGNNVGGYFNSISAASNSAYGVYSVVTASASSNTSNGVAGRFDSSSTRSGVNYGVYSSASGGSSNYSFYGSSGVFYNSDSVGIGVASPAQKLDVAGNIQLTGNIYKTTDYLYLSGLNGNTFIRGSGTNQGIRIDGTSQFVQAYAPVTGLESTLGVNPNGGNVGIGTNSPSYKLDVQGGQVNASGGLCIAGVCKTAWSQIDNTSKVGTASHDISVAGTQTIAHGLGRVPKLVVADFRVNIFDNGAGGVGFTGTGSYDGANMSCIAGRQDVTSPERLGVILQNSNYFFYTYVGSASSFCTISVDAVNINLTWAKSNLPTGVLYFNWRVE